MIKLGTVGSSKICDEFLSAAAKTGKYNHLAVYSRSYTTGAEFAKKHNVENIYTNLNEMALCGIDAVYIASPNVFHYEQSKLFLERGINVICEKPITTSYEQYCELLNLAKSKGLIYMEAIMSLHSPGYAKILENLPKIGNIQLARLSFCKRSARLDDLYSGKKVNIFDMSLHAGCLNDIGVYCVYAACSLFGMPRSITADADFMNNGCDKSGYAIFKYNGFSAVLTYSKSGQCYGGSEIIGDGGTITIDKISQLCGISLAKGDNVHEISEQQSKVDIMSYEADKFADLVLNRDTDELEHYSKIGENVHKCMDIIKKEANIIYKGD